MVVMILSTLKEKHPGRAMTLLRPATLLFRPIFVLRCVAESDVDLDAQYWLHLVRLNARSPT